MLQIIIFSKDRIFQLKECVRTLKKNLSHCSNFQIKVLWTYSNKEFETAYLDYFDKNPDIVSLLETTQKPFFELLTEIISNDITYTCFTVDDAIWYRPINLDSIYQIFDQIPIFSFSLRLDPHKTFCQPANNINKIPKLQDKENILLYDRRQGWGDWDYPFDLSGSIYKTKDVQNLINHLKQLNLEYNHPNIFEANSYLLFLHNKNLGVLNALNKQCNCSIITVNKSQNIFNNSLAGPEHTLEELLQLYWDGAEYDEDWYAAQTFDRIHIGDFRLKTSTLK